MGFGIFVLVVVIVVAIGVAVFGPWLLAAAVAGFGAWYLGGAQRGYFAFFSVLVVAVAGFYCAVIPLKRAEQLDALHLEEASLLCSHAAVHVLRRPVVAGPLLIGIYDGYLGPGNFKDVEHALRSRQTASDSPFRNVSLALLKTGEKPAEGVYPLYRREGYGSVSFSIVDPATGEMLAYATYLDEFDHATRAHYTGCGRTPRSTSGMRNADEVFGLIVALQAPDSQPPGAQPARAAHRRAYDVELDDVVDVRKDCSRGLTLSPELHRGNDYEAGRRGDDLVFLVLDRAAYDDAVSRSTRPENLNREVNHRQYLRHVVTCKGYFADDTIAGPLLHASGYVEPVTRVRALSNNTFYPFDFGPYRDATCTETIVTGGRSPEEYMLKREGGDLILFTIRDSYDRPIKVTPLINCNGYFSFPNPPDVRLGVSASRPEIDYPAAKVLGLKDGEWLGAKKIQVEARLKEATGKSPGATTPATPAPPPRTPKRNLDPERMPDNPWPAQPRFRAAASS